MVAVRRNGFAAALFVLLTMAALVTSAAAARAAPSPADSVLVTRVDGAITPVVAGHLADAVHQAERGDYQALIVEIDTPGGLDTSMREVVQAFLGAHVPVVVYVSPSGARAASAGAIITFSANIAAMAPGTTIGAATPIDAQTGEKASDKVINDAAAYAESIATQRGRDVDFAVDTVREGRAEPATEALKLGAIDLIATDQADLLNKLHGRTVTVAGGETRTLHTADATTVESTMSLTRKLLQLLADPNLAFLFLSLGTLALIYEFAYPGHAVSGITGVILLILGFFALSVLPVSVAGLALLLLAAALFAAELYAPGVGVFAVGGTISLALAGAFLFEGSVRVDPLVFLPTAVVIGLGSLLAGRLTWRARRAPPVTGASAMVGATATVAAQGDVFLEGTWWAVTPAGKPAGDEPLPAGQPVRVVAVDGLTLVVEPLGSVEQPGPTESRGSVTEEKPDV
ncbi:NfeD family protein [Hamadaea sp. NPDC050747]|uniref:NfeD family protein n=1 Tax=Hamadaea sp. NPDC050747 TaxID=3155789 RepID=UPI0033E2B5BC